MQTIVTTIQHRPYVMAFLLVFFVLAILHLGIFRALIWLIWGYAVAFVSEYSSIRNGFPYGLYHYVYENLQGELLIGGVPVWDSASYAFIAYASFATAWFFLEPNFLKFSIDPHVSPSRPLAVVLLGSILMMVADMIIDPVANLGEKWFLGKIYYYPEGGLYFGVPVSNFLGWLLVAFVIIACFQILEKFLFIKAKLPVWGAKRFPLQALLGPLFYFGILKFNLWITLQVEAYKLFAVSLGMTLVILGFVIRRLRQPSF
ncbi:MAG: hypothetical protein A2W61_08410 [Deltaproteobacteria bacterium RIFCSPLOWO2_01_44_7]|nr:MAG: hypothetical protein A2W61_08410 [Deltaproteobacteria bacterium RIFCSPLOWO2_01_44_7]